MCRLYYIYCTYAVAVPNSTGLVTYYLVPQDSHIIYRKKKHIPN